MQIYTKESLIKKIIEIRDMGWLPSTKATGNAGGVGNTLEHYLNIEENNLPIANAAEWELKAQRDGSRSLITLFHKEPSPTAFKFVPQILLPKYGWPHKQAGQKHPANELSFRQTIKCTERTSRGFGIQVDYDNKRIQISFDASSVDLSQMDHQEWLITVAKRVGLDELQPQPYWGFDDLYHAIGAKLKNTFFVMAKSRKENTNNGTVEYFHYSQLYMLQGITVEGMLRCIQNGYLMIDFDARTGHNHGTKFRLRHYTDLYEHVERIF
jgi:hypothetical protein